MTTKKKSLWITSVVALLLLIGGWVTGIQPQLSRTAFARASLTVVSTQNLANEKVLAQLKTDYQGIDALRNTLIALRASVPKSADVAPFVSELSALASAHGVEVKSISIDEAKPYTTNVGSIDSSNKMVITNPRITSNNFVLIPLQLSLNGTYSHVLDFIHSLQTANRLFFISNVGSTGSTSSDGLGKVDATLGGYIYALLNA